MYPHERSLVKRLENQPFALIGVNSDEDKEALKKAMVKEEITWRSFYDQSTKGPIASRWNIEGWPSIFVLDAEGKIRTRDVRGEELDKAVDELLAELAKPGTAKPNAKGAKSGAPEKPMVPAKNTK
jgi:hypothetical protein